MAARDDEAVGQVDVNHPLTHHLLGVVGRGDIGDERDDTREEVDEILCFYSGNTS